MANRRSGKPPHKVGERGWRHEHRKISQKYQIGPDITLVVSREAGRQVVVIKAPPSVKIERVDESDLQKVVQT